MPYSEPAFTVGVEEEYLLVDRKTRDLVNDPPGSMMAECEALLEGQVSPEFLRSQIEVETRVCTSISDARADLANAESEACTEEHSEQPDTQPFHAHPPQPEGCSSARTVCLDQG